MFKIKNDKIYHTRGDMRAQTDKVMCFRIR